MQEFREAASAINELRSGSSERTVEAKVVIAEEMFDVAVETLEALVAGVSSAA